MKQWHIHMKEHFDCSLVMHDLKIDCEKNTEFIFFVCVKFKFKLF